MTKKFLETKTLNLPDVETEILQFWDEANIFKKSTEARENSPVFTFYEGPPTANGRPGIHHVVGRTIKDAFCRYKSLKGYQVLRKGGWDTHGLPVEIEVEKQLGLDGREQVEEFGIEEFNAACKASVLRYKEEWDELTRRIGYWVDLDDPYVTFHNNYIETVWWLIKKIYDNGHLYKGHKVQWYSPGTGTVLSSHEVSLGYKEVTDPSVFVRFSCVGLESTYLLAWTTTPWTLMSNLALAINPRVKYVTISVEGENLILAEDCLGVLTDESYSITKVQEGKELVGMEYIPLFKLPNIEHTNDCWKVCAADFVTVEDGTGIVHMAPAFGADDSAVGAKLGLPLVNPVLANGHFSDETPLVGGLWFKDADKIIIRELKEQGLLYKRLNYTHNYPHDWRKGTPLMSYPVDSWFIKTTAVKDQLVAKNKSINWYPPSIREGRFGNWLENNVDWALSRKRYWGTPLPIWVSDKEGSEYFEVIGSVAELREKASIGNLSEELDLHRPFVDEISWLAPDGGTMRRVTDVLDVWFDSGAMPFAQWHYPFENKELFEKHFPADFICEGVDQTRGWFYTLHAIATLIQEDVAFKNVIVNGLVLDEKGEKMSKSKGNTVNPFDIVNKYGADVVRWYMMSNSSPWDSMKFSEVGLSEVRGKFFGTIENVYRFMASYANIDGFTYELDVIPASKRSELDQWILSRLDSTITSVDHAFANYDITRVARDLEKFVEELSNWYIRRSRPKFWSAKRSEQGENDSDSIHQKECAYQTTYDCLLGLAKLISPIAPFFGDWLYRNLNNLTSREEHQSVHCAFFPTTTESKKLPELEHKMTIARQIVQLVLLLRNRSNINVRQPLSRLLVVTALDIDEASVRAMESIILEEVNVRKIEFINSSDGIVTRKAKANFKALGPKFGSKMKALASSISKLSPEEIHALVSDGFLKINVSSEVVQIDIHDVEIISEEVGDWSVAQDGSLTIAIDTEINEELRLQGCARELVNRIQSMRKSADLNLTDRIIVEVQAPGEINKAIDEHAFFIRRETLSDEILLSVNASGNWNEKFTINDESVTIGLSTVK
jgi:isoleucyl-tRNA synthetase